MHAIRSVPAMKKLYDFGIQLTLQGPVLTKSTSPTSFGIDAAVARDFRTQKPMIPGTLIRGKLRESLAQLGELAQLERLFGKQTGSGGEDASYDPDRGMLLIGDLVADQVGASSTLSRVSLNSTLGAAEGEMLRVIEMPVAAGQEVDFLGKASVFCADESDAAVVARLLRLGLAWLVQVGANRTTGFGRVLAVEEVEFAEREAGALEAIDKDPVASLNLAISPAGPLCIARHKIGENLFESADIIPGAMVAGAIMQTAVAMGAQEELKTEFHKIRFLHAKPTTGEGRPRTLPLSTVKVPGRGAVDVAKYREPVLLKDGDGHFVAPMFTVDWKSHGRELAELGWAIPARELRVRTAIDSTNRRADQGIGDEGGKLFAMEMVHPFSQGAMEDSITWRSRIDLSGVSDPKAMATALLPVLKRLSFVSKTKATCQVEITAVETIEGGPELVNGQEIALVLETPALLVDPRFQELNGGQPHQGPTSAPQMLELYQAVWRELSKGALELSHHFASQFLAGGEYLAHRFQRPSRASYDPWLLTTAGSVFVFKVRDAEEARKMCNAWFRAGLALPRWACDQFGASWKKNPYRPENGFGEIARHVPFFEAPDPSETTPTHLAEAILPSLDQ